MTHQPPGTFLPPTADALAANQQQRLTQLEQRPQPADLGPFCQITATNPAPILTGDGRRTARWWPWRGALRLQYIIATADGLTEATTVVVRRGTPTGVVDQVTLEWSADGVKREGHDAVWTIGDYLDLTVEGQVSHLMVQLHFAGIGGGGLVFSVPAVGGGG